MFDVNISVKDGGVFGEFIIDSYFFEPSKYEYAFYLYKDDNKTDTVSYSENTKCTFNIKDMAGLFYIRAFIRDIQDRDIRSYDSEKILINS